VLTRLTGKGFPIFFSSIKTLTRSFVIVEIPGVLKRLSFVWLANFFSRSKLTAKVKCFCLEKEFHARVGSNRLTTKQYSKIMFWRFEVVSFK
jgi:hypothetical protein